MEIKKIETNLAPKPKGYYSQGVQIDNLIFTSGQLPLDPDLGEIIKGETEEQFIQIKKH